MEKVDDIEKKRKEEPLAGRQTAKEKKKIHMRQEKKNEKMKNE